MMKRPPLLIDAPLYRDRWPSSGPYAGQSFPPFAYGDAPEASPIQQPLPAGQFPQVASDMPVDDAPMSSISGLGATEVSVLSPLSLLGIGLSAYHGYKRHGDSPEWAGIWAFSSFALSWAVSPMLWPVVPAVGVAQGFAEHKKGRAVFSGTLSGW
jgi:hypothetical protein